MYKSLLVVAVSVVLGFSVRVAAQNDVSSESLTAAFVAKVLGSAVFVSGREIEHGVRESIYPFLSLNRNRPNDITQLDVDREKGEVRVAIKGGPLRTARFFGDQGMVIIPMGEDGVHFKPVTLSSTLPPADSTPWPMGDMAVDLKMEPGINVEKLQAGMDAMFAADAHTAAAVVVYRGQIIAERYAEGAHRDTPLESWSMGKTTTAVLYGLLAHQDDDWDPEKRGLFPEWANDERATIRLADLFRMSSGLKFSSRGDDPQTWGRGHPDHSFVYSGGIDSFDLSLSQPAEHPPNTVGRYRNCDPLLVGLLVKRKVEARGEDYLSFPRRTLFDKIGIRNMVLEPDPYGNFLLTGYDFGSARDWARMGMLLVQDGVWQGERLLPEGFVTFLRTPAPAWKNGEYGGLVWLEDGYFRAAGQGGQSMNVFPERDLVVVRMGHQTGTRAAGKKTAEALEKILDSLPH
jgi:CubicO group peptidase (beta-lactamase class C family)